MKYSDKNFDILLKQSLELAAEQDVESQDNLPLSEEKVIKLKEKYVQDKKSSKLNNKIANSVACFFAIILLLTGVALTNPTIRASVNSIIKSIFSDHDVYQTTESKISSLSDYSVGYIPNGYSLVEEDLLDDIRHYLLFENGEGAALQIIIKTSEGKTYLDNENNTFSQIEMNGYTIDIYESIGSEYSSTAICYIEESNIFIQVTGYLSVDELVQIITSIQ